MQAILSLPPIDMARLPYHHYVCTLTVKSAEVGVTYKFSYSRYKLGDAAQLEYHTRQVSERTSQSTFVIHMVVQLVGGAGYKAFLDAAPLISEPLQHFHFYMCCLDALQSELSRMINTLPTDN